MRRRAVNQLLLSGFRLAGASRVWMYFLLACGGAVGVLMRCSWVTVRIAKAHRGLPCVYVKVVKILFYNDALPNGGYFKCKSTYRPPLYASGVKDVSASSPPLCDLLLFFFAVASPTYFCHLCIVSVKAQISSQPFSRTFSFHFFQRKRFLFCLKFFEEDCFIFVSSLSRRSFQFCFTFLSLFPLIVPYIYFMRCAPFVIL